MVSWDILLDILIMLGSALLLGTLAEQLRQSAMLGYLVAGTLIGPNVLGFVQQGAHVNAIAELGVALLLFTIGLEFSFRRLRRLGRVALLGGVLQVLLTLAAGAVAAAIFGLGPRPALAIGAIVSLSSTACVLRLLVERAEIDSMYGRNVLGILLLQDVAVIPLMMLVVVLGGGSTPQLAAMLLGRTVLLAVALIGGFVLLFNFVVPRLLDIQRWSRNRELPVLLAIVLALGSAWAAHAVSLSPAIGAFVAGVLLGESPFATQIRADVGSLRTLLVTLFFASIGMLGNPAWVVAHVPEVVAMMLLAVVAKVVIVTAVLRMLGASLGVAVASGLCVAQIGEFSFVLAEVARSSEMFVGDDVFNLVVSVTILSLFLTPFLVASAPRVGAVVGRLRRAAAPKGGDEAGEAGASEAGRIVIIGFGPAGQAVAHGLYRHHRDSMLVIELGRRSAEIAQRLDLAVQIGDATHADVLEHAGIERARVIAITIPDPAMARSIVHLCRSLAPDAAVIVRCRYHTRRWELVMAGAREVVDEEEHVGMRIAAIARRFARPERPARSDENQEDDGETAAHSDA